MGHSDLVHFITHQIAQHPERRVTFAQFMDWALYHPQWGYYSSQSNRLGFQGDFVTAPQLSVDFGELLAEQFQQMWQILGQPVPFTLLEMGAGRGILARDILQYIKQHYPAMWLGLDYVIVERSPALIVEQQRQLQPFLSQDPNSAMAQPVRWSTWETIAPATIVGCCFSNELVDAFPVHRVIVKDNTLKELYVTATDAPVPFTSIVAPLSSTTLLDYFDLIGVDITQFPEGYCTEVNLAAGDWLATVADRLQRGYVVTIDYGYFADRYYSPTRCEGTLQCYYQHSYHNNPYVYVGQQDITAHVDFTALERWANYLGLVNVGNLEQALFLMALGLGDRIANLASSDTHEATNIQAVLRRREALHTLVNPMGMGNFRVLIQAKGLTSQEKNQPLRGLQIPSMSMA